MSKYVFIFICLLLVGFLLPGSSAQAQKTERVYRIGYLSTRSAEIEKSRLPFFLQGLQELGYREGENIIIERRIVPGQRKKRREIARELVDLKVDVIVTSGGSDAQAVMDVTKAIPIVFTVSADPVQAGLVVSLAHPGGNVTGHSDFHTPLIPKRLELIKEVVPTASRVGFLWNSNSTSGQRQLKQLQAVASPLDATLLSFEMKKPADFDHAFSAIRKEKPGALVVHGNALLSNNRRRIFEFAVKNRLPAIYTHSEWVEAGGLMSYGADFADVWRRTAVYVDKILKGRKPADLPVEQPKKFELSINLKTGQKIGLSIPPNVLVRADSVIR